VSKEPVPVTWLFSMTEVPHLSTLSTATAAVEGVTVGTPSNVFGMAIHIGSVGALEELLLMQSDAAGVARVEVTQTPLLLLSNSVVQDAPGGNKFMTGCDGNDFSLDT